MCAACALLHLSGSAVTWSRKVFIISSHPSSNSSGVILLFPDASAQRVLSDISGRERLAEVGQRGSRAPVLVGVVLRAHTRVDPASAREYVVLPALGPRLGSAKFGIRIIRDGADPTAWLAVAEGDRFAWHRQVE